MLIGNGKKLYFKIFIKVIFGDCWNDILFMGNSGVNFGVLVYIYLVVYFDFVNFGDG